MEDQPVLMSLETTEPQKDHMVHHKFDLIETLFLTVNLIHRFLAKQSVVRKKLQLVGLVSVILACKYEEVFVPVVDDLVFISDKAYTISEIIIMVLKFDWFSLILILFYASSVLEFKINQNYNS